MTAGVLEGKGRGGSLAIRAGSFNQLYGRSDAAQPESYLRFRVLPDTEQDAITAERALLACLYEAIEGTASDEESTERSSLPTMLVEKVTASIVVGYRECSLQTDAIDQVLREIAVHFDGVDPLKPDARAKLARCRARLAAMTEQLSYLRVEALQPSEDLEVLELLREVVHRAGTML